MEGFNDLQFYDYMRLCTAVLSALSAYRLGRRVRMDYTTYSKRLNEYVWVLFTVLFTQFFGALEAILRNTDYRYGALLSFFIALAMVRATRQSDEPLQHK